MNFVYSLHIEHFIDMEIFLAIQHKVMFMRDEDLPTSKLGDPPGVAQSLILPQTSESPELTNQFSFLLGIPLCFLAESVLLLKEISSLQVISWLSIVWR